MTYIRTEHRHESKIDVGIAVDVGNADVNVGIDAEVDVAVGNADVNGVCASPRIVIRID